MKNEIGFVIWGTKRGESKFFSSDNININEEEIKNAIEDIRSQISFDEPKVEFYALEFTSHYKVFTVYYSVIDWGNRSGGYLAITIFIPKDKKLPKSKGAINLLRQFLQVYKDNYILDNYRLSPDKENVQLFYSILNQYTLENETNRRHSRWEASTHNEKIALLWYKSDLELKDFFNNPYRKEFLQFQEVIFIAENLPQKERMYQSGLTTIENLKHIENEYNLKIQITDSFGNKIKPIIKVNGILEELPITNLSEDDKISIKAETGGHKPFEILRQSPLGLLTYGELSGKTISISRKLSVKTETVRFKLFEKLGFQDKVVEDNGKIILLSENDEVNIKEGNAAIQDVDPFKNYELIFQLNNYEPYKLNIKGSDLISQARRTGFAIQLKPTANLKEKRNTIEQETRQKQEERLREKKDRKQKKIEGNINDSNGGRPNIIGTGFKSKIFDFWKEHDIKILALTATLLLISLVTIGVLYLSSEDEETIVQEETFVHTKTDTKHEPKHDEQVSYQYEFIFKESMDSNYDGPLTLNVYEKNMEDFNQIEFRTGSYVYETNIIPLQIIYHVSGYKPDTIAKDGLENSKEFTFQLSKNEDNKNQQEVDELDDNIHAPETNPNKTITLDLLEVANGTEFSEATGALSKINNCDKQYLKNKKLNGSGNATCKNIKDRLNGMVTIQGYIKNKNKEKGRKRLIEIAQGNNYWSDEQRKKMLEEAHKINKEGMEWNDFYAAYKK